MQQLRAADIVARLRAANKEEFAVLQRSLVADTRKGVRAAVAAAERRLAAEAAEDERLEGLYAFERECASRRIGGDAQGALILGLDEVGRGPIAGPLAVGGVVLAPDAAWIADLNDSKQIRPEKREEIARVIKREALAWTVQLVAPETIDEVGMAAALRSAFRGAIAAVEAQGTLPDVILLDGNPLHLDAREVNVVKGDARCASIAAASIIAKVDRDALMVAYDSEFPGYDLASNKGYASPSHIAALNERGLSPIHRRTFCTGLIQEVLF